MTAQETSRWVLLTPPIYNDKAHAIGEEGLATVRLTPSFFHHLWEVAFVVALVAVVVSQFYLGFLLVRIVFLWGILMGLLAAVLSRLNWKRLSIDMDNRVTALTTSILPWSQIDSVSISGTRVRILAAGRTVRGTVAAKDVSRLTTLLKSHSTAGVVASERGLREPI